MCCRSHNGLQNFAGYLEYLGLGNSSSNSSCTETTELEPVNRIILVQYIVICVCVRVSECTLQGAIISTSNLGGALGNLLAGSECVCLCNDIIIGIGVLCLQNQLTTLVVR